MAILKKIKVTIEVDGKPLEEYHDNEEKDEARSITRYIEATSGATFAIKIRLKRSFKFLTSALGFDFKLDGEYVDNYGLKKSEFKPHHGGHSHVQYGAYVEGSRLDTLKPFIFEDIKIGLHCLGILCNIATDR